MDVGFVRAGFEVVAANELDSYACATFRKNHLRPKLFEGDVQENIHSLTSIKDIDVVFGGPPCQGFSVAGKMKPDDPRSQLIFSFAEVVERLRPKAFVMENVKSLGTLAKFSEIRARLVSRLQKSGYSVQIHLLNAKDFGVPQSRERVFFIGIRTASLKSLLPAFRRRQKEAPTLREVVIPLGKPGSPKNDQVCNAKVTFAKKPVLRKSPYAGMLFNGQGRPLNPDGWASTLPASMGGNRTPIVDEQHLYENKPSWVEEYHRHLIEGGEPKKMSVVPSYLRRLTINEVALLQGFPTGYKFCGSNSKIYSQIGNAVPCDLAQTVANVVWAVLSGSLADESDSILEGENLELAL
ncbi:MAG: DNA (cytosine-5-)-methyltransferase [Leptolyngbya foveolarum]|uniref:Cytosine-specific methyltransferase n=1 Tax=Leptolyngbya foveolarum TaxID=47253 RepID=A0A2W4UEQ7_9CYAN|nr:MAG: DNA (cytosine-5-)-methyltransferase [Leptolyngbya foveolarum]